MSNISDEDNKTANWRKYIRVIGLGSSFKASCARLCHSLNCDNASSARKKVAGNVQAGKIDQDAAMTYLDAISEVESMYAKGEQTHKINTNTQDWHPIQAGCHVRKVFTHS